MFVIFSEDGPQSMYVCHFSRGWTTTYVSLDNVGVWNLRADNLDCWFLGQEKYMRIVNLEDTSNKTKLFVPDNALYCGVLSGKQKYRTITSLTHLAHSVNLFYTNDYCPFLFPGSRKLPQHPLYMDISNF
ncbi:unnamed protein product [Fraxinus pennsylvanica]|uniref:Uncharacterized protein n=1 Tax=Fraxinus pennsylvanica TaxID=56036 RepID=A0AAD2DSP2_9LAMI|nr:unnamed protein product [Fraxinus pennsylvanica]